MTPLIGMGAYGVSEAARFARVNVRTTARWISGDGAGHRGALFRPDLPRVAQKRALSFLDLIDVLVVGRFREHGVSLQKIRRVHARLVELLNTPHPFAHLRFFTDGKDILAEKLNTEGDAQLMEILSGQSAMPAILRPYLQQIDYATDTGSACRWNIAEGIVIDPNRALGKPVVASEGTTTFVLARAYAANDRDAEMVAGLYGVSPKSVLQAVDFEAEYALRRAA